MTTIANRKFSELRQLEFQSVGTSEVNTMLLQPLLDKSSTWVAEITDLQVDLSDELAFPANKRLFTIFQKPLPGAGREIHFEMEFELYVAMLSGHTETLAQLSATMSVMDTALKDALVILELGFTSHLV